MITNSKTAESPKSYTSPIGSADILGRGGPYPGMTASKLLHLIQHYILRQTQSLRCISA
jgi:hypothetical protein